MLIVVDTVNLFYFRIISLGVIFPWHHDYGLQKCNQGLPIHTFRCSKGVPKLKDSPIHKWLDVSASCLSGILTFTQGTPVFRGCQFTMDPDHFTNALSELNVLQVYIIRYLGCFFAFVVLKNDWFSQILP